MPSNGIPRSRARMLFFSVFDIAGGACCGSRAGEFSATTGTSRNERKSVDFDLVNTKKRPTRLRRKLRRGKRSLVSPKRSEGGTPNIQYSTKEETISARRRRSSRTGVCTRDACATQISVFAWPSSALDSNCELRGFREEISTPDVRRYCRPVACFAHAEKCGRAKPSGARLFVRRATRHRENLHCANFSESAQLHSRADRDSVRRVR